MEQADINLLKVLIEYNITPEKVHVKDWDDHVYPVSSIGVDDKGEIFILIDELGGE